MPKYRYKSELRNFALDRGVILADQTAIVDKATEVIFSELHYTTEQVKDNFDELIEVINAKTYELYIKYETEYGKQALRVWLASKGEINSPEKAAEILGVNFQLFVDFYKSLGQGRMSRAGAAAEAILYNLFRQLSYPFEEQALIEGDKPDFLMPSKAHYETNAMDCIIFTSKRTLRERWRQIVTEGSTGVWYLATLDKDISGSQLDGMKARRIYVVVPESIKAQYYSSAEHVISFKDFFEHHLDPKVTSWKSRGVLKEAHQAY